MPAVKTGPNEINKECLVLHSSKKVYLPVSKAANTSIKRSLLKGQDSTEFCTKDRVIREFMDYFKVTVVRNPFDRLVSTFSFFTQRQPQYFKNLGDIYFSDFEGFIREVYSHPDEVSNAHYRSQYNLLSQDGIFLPDLVVKYENLQEVKDYLPIDVLEHSKHTKSEHEHYRNYYTPELVSKVERRFWKDLEFFRYEF